MPAGIADRRVAGLAAPLACGENERERRVPQPRTRLELLQFRQQLGQVQVDPVVRQSHGFPAVGVFAHREDQARWTVQDRVEQAIAGEDRVAAEELGLIGGQSDTVVGVVCKNIICTSPWLC